jgi:peptidoglycan/xylan/chitin deacetylase (PgdA/CDA1 family)
VPKIKLSVDDGCASDIRVAELADKYEIPTVFYWPVEWTSLAFDNAYSPLTYDEALAISRRYEIGSHTITHRHLTKLSEEEAMYEIIASKLMLGRLFDKEITKFCPPRGYTNERLTDFTLKIYDSQRLTKGKGLVHIHPDSGANGNMPWREYFDLIKDPNDEVELWGHSWEWNKYDLWNEIEEFFRERTHS